MDVSVVEEWTSEWIGIVFVRLLPVCMSAYGVNAVPSIMAGRHEELRENEVCRKLRQNLFPMI